jgi:hypothetical protein
MIQAFQSGEDIHAANGIESIRGGAERRDS